MKKRFELIRQLNIQSRRKISSDQTPTTISPRLIRTRPEVFEAVDTNTSNRVILKRTFGSNAKSLIDEASSIRKLKKSKLAPRLISDVTFDRENYYSFFVTEYFGSPWRSLKNLVENKLISTDRAFENLYRALSNAVRLMHQKNIVHGDIKPEHVFVDLKKDVSRPYEIRFIDFGMSYTTGSSPWRGGTVGYAYPLFWPTQNQMPAFLTREDLLALDYYAMCATLYYVYTGETFRLTSPAYKTALFSEGNRYILESLYRNEIDEKHRGCSPPLKRIIEILCDPFAVNDKKVFGLYEPA